MDHHVRKDGNNEQARACRQGCQTDQEEDRISHGLDQEAPLPALPFIEIGQDLTEPFEVPRLLAGPDDAAGQIGESLALPHGLRRADALLHLQGRQMQGRAAGAGHIAQEQLPGLDQGDAAADEDGQLAEEQSQHSRRQPARRADHDVPPSPQRRRACSMVRIPRAAPVCMTVGS